MKGCHLNAIMGKRVSSRTKRKKNNRSVKTASSDESVKNASSDERSTPVERKQHNIEFILSEHDVQLIAELNSDISAPRRKQRSVPTVLNSPSIACLLDLSEEQQHSMRTTFTGKKTQTKKQKLNAENISTTAQQQGRKEKATILLQKQLHDEQCWTVKLQLEKIQAMKLQQQINKLQYARSYKQYYVAKKKEESLLEFKRQRSEVSKQYHTKKAQSVVPSAEQLAERELLKNNKFLETIRAAPIQRNEQLPSCLSPMCKPIIGNQVRITFDLCTVTDVL